MQSVTGRSWGQRCNPLGGRVNWCQSEKRREILGKKRWLEGKAESLNDRLLAEKLVGKKSNAERSRLRGLHGGAHDVDENCLGVLGRKRDDGGAKSAFLEGGWGWAYGGLREQRYFRNTSIKGNQPWSLGLYLGYR